MNFDCLLSFRSVLSCLGVCTLCFMYGAYTLPAAFPENVQLRVLIDSSPFTLFVMVWIASAFTTKLARNLLLLCGSLHPCQALQAVLSAHISLISCLYLMAIALGYGPLIDDEQLAGNHISPLRYLLWTFTLPAMVAKVVVTAPGQLGELWYVILMELPVIMLGLGFEVLPWPLIANVCYALSTTCHVYVSHRMYTCCKEARLEFGVVESGCSSVITRMCELGFHVGWNTLPTIPLLQCSTNILSSTSNMENAYHIVFYLTNLVLTRMMDSTMPSNVYERKDPPEGWACIKSSQEPNEEAVAMESEAGNVAVATMAKTTTEPAEAAATISKAYVATQLELLTPLRGIVGLTRSMLTGSAGALSLKFQQFLTAIEVAVSAVLAVLDDGCNDAVQGEKLQLKPLLDMVVLMNEALAKEGRVEVEVEEDLPPVSLNQERFLQIMNMLVSSSMRATPVGFIRIVARSVHSKKDVDHRMVQVAVIGTALRPVSAGSIQMIFQALTEDSDKDIEVYARVHRRKDWC